MESLGFCVLVLTVSCHSMKFVGTYSVNWKQSIRYGEVKGASSLQFGVLALQDL